MVRVRGTRRHRWLWTAVAVALAVGFLWAVEVGSPRTIDATGVDELEIPLGDVTSVDFVDGVDHPWLPLRSGALWAFGSVDGAATVRTEVLSTTVDVDGVEATQVRTVVDGTASVRWYAQDVDGHVWLLGEEGAWSVADGTPAGLAIPAEPRRGDGFVRVPGPAGGDPVEWWSVGEQDGDVTVAGRTHEDVLAVRETRTDEGAERPYELLLARDVGPVRITDGRGVLELVEHTPGAG